MQRSAVVEDFLNLSIKQGAQHRILLWLLFVGARQQ